MRDFYWLIVVDFPGWLLRTWEDHIPKFIRFSLNYPILLLLLIWVVAVGVLLSPIWLASFGWQEIKEAWRDFD